MPVKRSIAVSLTALVACVVVAGTAFAFASGSSANTRESFAARSRAAAARYRNVAIATHDGYRLDNRVGAIDHWRNDNRLVSGTKIDPTRPSGLMYEWRHGRRVLVAAVFLMRAPGLRPPPVVGLHWHHHPFCAGSAGIATPAPGTPCPPGTSRRFTPAMTHVFLAVG